MTVSQKRVFDFLRRMQQVHGTDRWFTPFDVKESSPNFSTCGGCARLLQSLVKAGQAEVRTATTIGRWLRMEYRAKVD